MFKTFNRYAPFKAFKTSEKTVPVGSDVAIAPIVSSTILDLTRRKGKLVPKGFRPSFQLLLRSRTSAYLRMRRVIGLKRLERLEQLEPLELLKWVRLHGGN